MPLVFKFPVQIFLIFEKIKIQAWTSKANLPNNYFLYLPKKWVFSINNLLKFGLCFWNSTLVDLSAIDCSNFKEKNFNSIFSFSKKFIVYYIYYFFFLKIKLNITVIVDPLLKKNLKSIDVIYFNSGWLERETSEMFGIAFSIKKDLRKLLTDYSNIDNPLLKSYPSEGFLDVFYNFFEDQVLLTVNIANEL